MSDEKENTIPKESLLQEKPLVEYFPQLKPLGEGVGTKVDLFINGERYQISAHRYLDDGKWPHKDHYRTIFAVWGAEGNMVAYADYKINREGWATCDDRSLLLPEEIKKSANIGPSVFGFFVQENYRGKGIGDTLLATSLLVLEGMGVRGVDFVSDATRSDCVDVEYWPQWFSDPNNHNTLRQLPMSSFYTRYHPPIAYKEDSTVLSTRLSAMQLSLLDSALRGND